MNQLRVIKIGGSLLTWPSLIAELTRWLDLQSPARTVAFVGGGKAVDAIRRRQAAEPSLSDAEAHWLSIRAMNDNADMLRGTFGGTIEFADAWNFMQADARGPDPLPLSWAVTSDSIAARAAVRWNAAELVLLKSTTPSSTTALEGVVDDYFVTASRRLKRIRLVNLRDPKFADVIVCSQAEPGNESLN